MLALPCAGFTFHVAFLGKDKITKDVIDPHEEIHIYIQVSRCVFQVTYVSSLQEMTSAVITYCGHFFHGNCLRKWLYVQETCPMCHQTVRPTATAQSPASDEAPTAPAQRAAGPDPAAEQERDQSQDNGTSEETQSDAVTPDPTEQRESFEDGDGGTGDKDKPAEPHREAVQGLRFTSSGDFVGFVSPASSCSSRGDSSSHVLLGGNKHDSCEETPESYFDSPESNTNLEASGVSLVNSQTSVKSCNKNSELFDVDPQSHKGNGTYSDFDRLREAETVPQFPRLSSSDATFSCTNTDTSD